ncbi:MAG: hypothetical protein EOP33_07060 [Rickettsiaceae bacterium]|nr:MAG: hypothetical protein EOP33_07060 [Rickettsiaceae bacterium]
MTKKFRNIFNLKFESPWPFLVSTASLFFTLGAVLFLDSFVQDIDCCMMGWFGVARNFARKTVLTHLGGYSGVVVNNYGTKPSNFIYGKVTFSPENYDTASIRMLDDLAMAYTQRDKEKIYTIWRLVMCNPEGMFSKNYGKLCNTINMMTNEYNREVGIDLEVTEKTFFEINNIVINDKSLSIIPQDQFNSMIETSQIEIASRKAQGSIEYQRNLVEHQVEGIANLGLQSNNDYVVTLKYDKNTGGIYIGYVDCKKLDEISFKQKLEVLRNDGYGLKPLEGTRAVFGCNLYLVAKEGEDLILDSKEKVAVLNFIHTMAKENPNFFKDYQNSHEYKEFEKTGNFAALSTSVYPFPKGILSHDYRKYLRFKPVDEREIYNKYLLPESEGCKNSSIISIVEIAVNDN